jgi:hypothetical protein
VVTRHLLDAAGLKADEGQGGAVTLIQRFGSAANLNIHLHCLVLDGVYRRGADGSPAFIEAASPTDDELHALLQAAAVASPQRQPLLPEVPTTNEAGAPGFDAGSRHMLVAPRGTP